MYNDCERCHSSGKAICVKCHEDEINDLKAQVARLNEEIGRGSDNLDGLVRDFYSLMEYRCACPISEHCEFCLWAVHDQTGGKNPHKDDDETCIERIKNHYSKAKDGE